LQYGTVPEDESKASESSCCDAGGASAATPSSTQTASCPVSGATDGSPGSSPATLRDKLRALVRIPGDINLIFALAVEPRHEPYFGMKPVTPPG